MSDSIDAIYYIHDHAKALAAGVEIQQVIHARIRATAIPRVGEIVRFEDVDLPNGNPAAFRVATVAHRLSPHGVEATQFGLDFVEWPQP